MKKEAKYAIDVEGREVSDKGLASSFIGPFSSLFENDRQVGDRIADQTREYLRNGRILALAVDQLLEHLLQNDGWDADARYSAMWVRVRQLAMRYLEDLDREPHNYVNVILNTYSDTRRMDFGVTVFDMEGFPTLDMAMAASNERLGASADVWTLDLTTIEVAMRQIASTELNYYEVEKRAAELLKEHGSIFWHSGGGIWLALIEIPSKKLELLVSESEQSPGRFWLGVYDVADGERNEEAEMFDLLTSTDLKKKVAELVPGSDD